MFVPPKSPSLLSRLSTLSGISFLLCALGLAVTPASGQQEQESVVLVHTKLAKPSDSGYGVAWQQTDNIVTALHLVAGKSQIIVQWKDKESSATIKKINKEADLALLQLQTPLGVPALQIYQGDPPLDRPLNYWESPEKTNRMDRKETKLNAEKRAIPLRQFDSRLAQDEKTLATFAKALCSDGQINYPALSTKVYKFEERSIKKAHSGSPITYQGKIVGLVDGGQPIGAAACVWAIPAASNFQQLSASSAAPPGKTCSSEKLYGGLRADNPFLEKDARLEALADTLAYYEDNPFDFVDDSNDRLAFDLEYRAPFRDFYDTMFEEDHEYIKALLEDEKDFEDGRVTLQDLFNQSIDVFQDEETGATIAIPTASDMHIEKSKEGKHTLIEVSSPYAGIEMIIYVQKTASVDASKAAMQWFEQYLVSDGQDWVKEKNAEGEEGEIEVEDLLNDPDEPYYNELMERVVYGSDQESIDAELYASLTIDEENFLGVAVIVNHREQLTREERICNYLVEACAILSDFAYY